MRYRVLTRFSTILCSFILAAVNHNALAQSRVPTVTGAHPTLVTQGARGTHLRLFGTGLQPGLQIVESGEPGSAPLAMISFTPVRTLSATLAVTNVSVHKDTPAGTYLFTVLGSSPDGFPGPIGSFTLRVSSRRGLTGPAAVDTVAIVFPQEGTVIGRNERLFPRGLLGVTGSGTVTGFWELDGVPFDRFVASVRAGHPVQVASKVPIPTSAEGGHNLLLRIDSPATAFSAPVRLVMVSPQAPLMRIVTPRDHTVSASGPEGGGPTFRWTPQPGAAYYEVLLSSESRLTPTTKTYRSKKVSWKLPSRTRTDLRSGAYWWTVRPVFAGGVRGEVLKWRHLELLPETVTPKPTIVTHDRHSGDTEFAWTDTPAAVIHRLEFFEAATPLSPLLSAITTEQRWHLPAALSERYLPEHQEIGWRVIALAPGGFRLGSAEGETFAVEPTTGRQSDAIIASSSDTICWASTPAGINDPHTIVAATWRQPIEGKTVRLLVDDTDVTELSMVTPKWIRYSGPPETTRSIRRVAILLNGRLYEQDPEILEHPVEFAPEATTEPESILDWQVDLQGTLTWISGNGPGEEDDLRINATASFFRERESGSVNGSVNLALLQQFDEPHDLVQEARSYAFNGAIIRPGWTLDGTIGWTGPTIAATSSFLNAGLSRAGLEFGAQTPAGMFRAYATYNEEASGYTSSTFGTEQKVRMAAWTAPLPEETGTLELVVTDVVDLGNVDMGLPRMEGDSLGLIGSFGVGTNQTLDFEIARSAVDEEAVGSQAGNAYRVGYQGVFGNTNINTALQRTDAEFANLASGSLMLGSIPNRTSFEAGASWLFTQSSTNVGYRYSASDAIEQDDLPAARQHALDASYMTSLSQKVQLSLTGNYSHDNSDASTSMPTLRIHNVALDGGLSQTLGTFTLSENLGWQGSRYSGYPDADLSDMDVYSLNLSGSGMANEQWSLATSLSWSRLSPNLGDSIQTYMASIQPAWNRGRISLNPWISATWSQIPTAGWERNLLAQMMAAWNPDLGKGTQLGISFFAGWNETRTPGFGNDPEISQSGWSVSASLTLSWSKSGSLAARPAHSASFMRPNIYRLRRATVRDSLYRWTSIQRQGAP
ncbi:MAG: hypothetical protein GY906_21710 [bacterium]|nr:hypothetical protein [bacterium]